MYFADALTLDAPKRLKDGYLAVRAKAARVGTYDYAGYELDPENRHGLRDQAVVKVLRDENTVFDAAAVRSFIGKPITNDHPREGVNASNWRDHARGTIMGALRDGEYLAFDLLLTDQAAIDAVNSGKRELSNGYSAAIEFGDFTAPDGTKCQARQSKITDGNHVALVDQGRAGPDCRIADAPWAVCDALSADQLSAITTKKEPAMATIVVDGLPISLADEAAVRAVLDKKDAALAAADKALADAKAGFDRDLAARDAKIDELKGQVIDQAKIDALADAKAAVVADARKLVGDKLPETAGKSVADVRRLALAVKLGDAAVEGKSDDYVSARFDAALEGFADKGGDKVVSLTPAAPASTSAVRDTIRAARYA